MIRGIALEPRLQLAERARRLVAGLGQFQRRAGGRDLGMVACSFGTLVEDAWRLGELLAADGGAGEPGQRIDLAGLVLQHLAIDVGGARGSPAAIASFASATPRHRIGRPRAAAAPPAAAATNCFTWLSGSAPTKPSTGRPSLKA